MTRLCLSARNTKILITVLIFSFLLVLNPHILLNKTNTTSSATEPCPCETKRPHISEDPRIRSEMLEKLFEDLEISARESSNNILTIDGILYEVGSDDPAAIFEWIRDNTQFTPYQGSLKGASGVLIDGMGNSLDRALLLHALLSRAGFEARLARGKLSEDKANQIAQTLNPEPRDLSSTERRQLLDPGKDLIDKYAKAYNLDRSVLVEAVEDKKAFEGQLLSRLSQSSAKHTSQLLRQVKKLQDSDLEMNKKRILIDIQDHWWVQVQGESGWMDLDPTLSHSIPGNTFTGSIDSLQPDELDDALRHQITIRIKTEQWKDKQLKVHEVLSHSFCPADILGHRVILYHTSSGWSEDMDVFEENEQLEAFKEMILQAKSWTPHLQVGPEEIENLGFTRSGRVGEDVDKGESSGSPAGIMGGFQRAMRGGKSEEEDEKNAYLTAEWIEFEIYSPGQPKKIIKREIFDLLGPAKRMKKNIAKFDILDHLEMKRNLSLLGFTEFLPLCCYLSDEFIQNIANSHFLANKDIVLSLFDRELRQDPDSLLKRMTEIQEFPIPLYMLASLRFRGNNYLASPNIFTFHSYLRENPNGFLDSISALDIVDHQEAVTSTNIQEAFQIRIKQGVHDSFAESLSLADRGEKDNLTNFYDEMKKQNIEWQTFHTPQDDSLQKSKLPEEFSARIKMDLAQGYIIVAPEKDISIDGDSVTKYWRINPKTGDTLIIGEHGWGQEASEYLITVDILTQMHGWYSLVSNIIKCTTAGIIAALADETKTNEFVKCVLEVICGQMYKKFEDYCDLELNWTNFILKQLAGYLAGEFCKLLFEEL